MGSKETFNTLSQKLTRRLPKIPTLLYQQSLKERKIPDPIEGSVDERIDSRFAEQMITFAFDAQDISLIATITALDLYLIASHFH